MNYMLVPDYFEKFKCIGSDCEDTCCSGWSVNIDRDTYHQYKKNRHKVLEPLFKIAISRDTSDRADSSNNFGLMKMKPDGACHFLQADQLCAIQNTLGAAALSHTCQVYPRIPNKFGSQLEMTLGLSCPEAARLILQNPQPMQFLSIPAEGAAAQKQIYSYRFPLKSEGDPDQMAVLTDFRALIIAILQFRETSLGARLMLLGLLLAEADNILHSETFSNADELSPTLSHFARYLSNPEEVEAEFSKIQSNPLRKLEVLTGVIIEALAVDSASSRFRQCILMAVEGLQKQGDGLDNTFQGLMSRFQQNHKDYYQPFIKDKEYYFENYLVNQVVSRLFPFTRGTFLDLYRAMVFNVAILQVLLVGMAATRQGLDDHWVIQLFQSFSRKVDHNASYLDVLIKAMRPDEHDSFVNVMWLLKE